jgi:regulator of nonsense transcripts 1
MPLQTVRVVVEDPSGSFATRGEVIASGQRATYTDKGSGIGDRKIVSITGIGREAPTMAQKARDRSLLRLLQRLESPDNPWLRNIWFNKTASSITWPETWFPNDFKYPKLSPAASERLSNDAKRLNPSQQIAVNAMLSKDPKNVITIIQGPPGTGKTSVIAFFVQMAVALGKTGIWLIAQSNVAVKNIAEKLSKVGFHDYRLLVSQDFIGDWWVTPSHSTSVIS